MNSPSDTVGPQRHRGGPRAHRAACPAHAAAWRSASPIAGAPPISLKLEFLQHSGSFKPRGAFNNLLTRAAPAGRLRDRLGRQSWRRGRLCRARARACRRRCSCPRSPRRGEDRQDQSLWRRRPCRGRAIISTRSRSATPMSPRAARSRCTPTIRRETIAGQGTVGLEWEEDLGRLGSARARHRARRGRRRRADLGHRGLVRRPGQGRRRRARGLARAARGARGGRARSTSSDPLHRRRFARRAPGRRNSASISAGAASSGVALVERRRHSRGAAHALARFQHRSPSPAARRPMPRWRAAPMFPPPDERVGVLRLRRQRRPRRILGLGCNPECCGRATSHTMVRPLCDRRPRPSRPVGA